MHTAQGAWQLWSTKLAAGCTGCQPFLFARRATSIPYLMVYFSASTERYGHYCLKAQCTPEVPLFLLRPLVGRGGSHSLHPKQDYSADLNLAPAHPSFKRRTNSYWPRMASSQLLTKHISPSDSGRPISLQYLRDRLTSAQKLPRNEADKEALLLATQQSPFLPTSSASRPG